MKINKRTIVITDPCYLKDSHSLMSRGTIYGDWSCMVYPGVFGDKSNKQFEWDQIYFTFFNEYNFGGLTPEEKAAKYAEYQKQKETWLKENTLGEFCADAGEVGIFCWDFLSEEEKKWVKEHPWCAAVIEDFEGDVSFMVDDNDNVHVIGDGPKPFYTVQSGL